MRTLVPIQTRYHALDDTRPSPNSERGGERRSWGRAVLPTLLLDTLLLSTAFQTFPTNTPPAAEPHARRVILISVDGLRPDAISAAPMPTLILVTADHGGHAFSHGTDMPEDMLIPFIAAGSGVMTGTILQDVRNADAAPTILYALGIDAPEMNLGRAITEIFSD